MIFVGLLNTIYSIIWVITSPVRLLNDVTLSTSFAGAISTANSYLSPLNVVLPMETILWLLGLVIIIEVAYFGWKILMWVIRRIPTQS